MSFGDGPGYWFQCPNECLVTKLCTFSRTAKFDVKTVMNEEIFYGTSCTSERLKESTLAVLIVDISK